MSIKEVAIRKAISILASVGAEFKIIDSDGNEFGELKVTKERPARKKYKDLYLPHVQNLAIGSIATIKAPDGTSAEGVRSAAQAWAISHWGTGSTISARKDSKIEILRVY